MMKMEKSKNAIVTAIIEVAKYITKITYHETSSSKQLEPPNRSIQKFYMNLDCSVEHNLRC